MNPLFWRSLWIAVAWHAFVTGRVLIEDLCNKAVIGHRNPKALPSRL